MTCYLWNYEYGFIESELDDDAYANPIFAYANGFYDTEENLKHPSYLRSDLQMPDYTLL